MDRDPAREHAGAGAGLRRLLTAAFDAAAPFGARYGLATMLGLDDQVSPLAPTAASIAIGDLLP